MTFERTSTKVPETKPDSVTPYGSFLHGNFETCHAGDSSCAVPSKAALCQVQADFDRQRLPGLCVATFCRFRRIN